MRVQVRIKKRKAHVKGRKASFFFPSFFLLLTWLALRRRTIPGRSYFPRVIGLDTTPTFSFLPARFPIISSVGCRSLPTRRSIPPRRSLVCNRKTGKGIERKEKKFMSLSLSLSTVTLIGNLSFSLSLIPCFFFFSLNQVDTQPLPPFPFARNSMERDVILF